VVYGNDRLLKISFLKNVALALQQKPSWCMSLQTILAPFEFVIQVNPQPFGTDFQAELKNRFIENFMEPLDYHNKNQNRDIQHN
jgi:hypothetical protein